MEIQIDMDCNETPVYPAPSLQQPPLSKTGKEHVEWITDLSTNLTQHLQGPIKIVN